MSHAQRRDVEHYSGHSRMLGELFSPGQGAQPGRPPVLLIHDAFGLGPFITDIALALAERGHAVFAADIWGERTRPASEAEIGPLIGSMVGNHAEWIARLGAAHAAAAAQPEIAGAPLVALGYCFGGSSALEYLRSGAALAGVIAIHPGLDLIGFDYAVAGDAPVLLCLGASDPMATPEQRERLAGALSQHGNDWEMDLYGHTVHAFTNPASAHSPHPEVVAHHPVNAARAWKAALGFLDELSSDPPADPSPHSAPSAASA